MKNYLKLIILKTNKKTPQMISAWCNINSNSKRPTYPHSTHKKLLYQAFRIKQKITSDIPIIIIKIIIASQFKQNFKQKKEEF